jgi:hypothetical protein
MTLCSGRSGRYGVLLGRFFRISFIATGFGFVIGWGFGYGIIGRCN